MELIDENLKLEVDWDEVENVVKVAISCTNLSPSLRPTMSEVVKMLEGEIPIPDVIPEPAAMYSEDFRFNAMRDLRRNQSCSRSQGQTRPSLTSGSSSKYSQEFFEINPGSMQ